MKTSFLIYRHPDANMLSLQGAVFTVFFIILSGININAFSYVISLAWLPLAAIFLWPRWAHPIATPIIIAALGLFSDLLMGRFLGVSSLLFLILFWISKPIERETQLNFIVGWLEFSLIISLLLMTVFYCLGRILDLAVGWRSLIEQILVAIALFPLVYGLRRVIRLWVIDPNDVNYQS